jgi:hypothetical protein
MLELWHARKHNIAVLVVEAIKRNPILTVKDYTVSDLSQMFEGFIAMISESLEGKGNDIRETFMTTVIPGILAQGQTLNGLIGQFTMNATIVYDEIVPRASAAHREQIGTYLMNWYVGFNVESVKIGLSMGCKS